METLRRLLITLGATAGGAAVLIWFEAPEFLEAAPYLAAASCLFLAAGFAPWRTIFRKSRSGAEAQTGRKARVVVDGSNVMYWKSGEPDIEAVREVVRDLLARGLEVGVMFDANAGYLLTDRYRHHDDFAMLLGLPESHIMVVPKGAPADGHILTAARDLDARVVSNDRFRDWAETYPEVREPRRLVTGGYASGRLTLDFGEDGPRPG